MTGVTVAVDRSRVFRVAVAITYNIDGLYIHFDLEWCPFQIISQTQRVIHVSRDRTIYQKKFQRKMNKITKLVNNRMITTRIQFTQSTGHLAAIPNAHASTRNLSSTTLQRNRDINYHSNLTQFIHPIKYLKWKMKRIVPDYQTIQSKGPCS